MMHNSYQNVWSSLMNVAKRFKDAHPDYNFEDVLDFDDADGTNLPKGNLIGIYQLDYMENDGLIYAQVLFPVSLEGDTGSVELNKVVGEFVQFVRRNTNHPLYDYESAQILGNMKAGNDLNVSPKINTNSRDFKFVMQSFLFDQATNALVP